MYQKNNSPLCAEIQTLPEVPEDPGFHMGGESLLSKKGNKKYGNRKIKSPILFDNIKFSICSFDQQKLIEYGMDSVDVFILCFIRDLPIWATMHVPYGMGDKRYYWCNYEAILRDYPIVRITRDTLKSRMKKYKEKGLIDIYIWRSSYGTRSMVYTTDSFLNLIYKNKKHE